MKPVGSGMYVVSCPKCGEMANVTKIGIQWHKCKNKYCITEFCSLVLGGVVATIPREVVKPGEEITHLREVVYSEAADMFMKYSS